MTEEEKKMIKEWEEEIRKEHKENEVSDEDLLYQENGFASKKDFWIWKEGLKKYS